ncbi:MAG: hypothetical protein Q8P06_01360 [Candidatus Azambacteria bacterium]|nr:hypothetical protein [Candidatus Azambacteria bacterium]
MPTWINETKKNISALKERGFFNSWAKREIDPITFFIYPDLVLPNDWVEKRLDIYKENAKKLKAPPPKVAFYVYPSIDAVKNLEIVPAITFVKEKEIHGHLKQSPGHELTHILLGEINTSKNLPANGLWAEGICVYLDGTETDRKFHTLSLKYDNEILKTPWEKWRKSLPGDLYPLAGSITQYCVEKYDINIIRNFLEKLRDNGKNDNIISEKIFQLPYSKLQENWREWLKK